MRFCPLKSGCFVRDAGRPARCAALHHIQKTPMQTTHPRPPKPIAETLPPKKDTGKRTAQKNSPRATLGVSSHEIATSRQNHLRAVGQPPTSRQPAPIRSQRLPVWTKTSIDKPYQQSNPLDSVDTLIQSLLRAKGKARALAQGFAEGAYFSRAILLRRQNAVLRMHTALPDTWYDEKWCILRSAQE